MMVPAKISRPGGDTYRVQLPYPPWFKIQIRGMRNSTAYLREAVVLGADDHAAAKRAATRSLAAGETLDTCEPTDAETAALCSIDERGVYAHAGDPLGSAPSTNAGCLNVTHDQLDCMHLPEAERCEPCRQAAAVLSQRHGKVYCGRRAADGEARVTVRQADGAEVPLTHHVRHSHFKFEVIALLPEAWEITSEQIEQWIASQQQEAA